MFTILVGSGKGGVGKSTVSSVIATHLTSHYNVGLLDCDLSCPSLSRLFNISDYQFKINKAGKIVPPQTEGVNPEKSLKVFSIGGDIPEQQFVAWKGSTLADIISEQFNYVSWSDVDVLVVDMPPSTNDSVQTILDHCSRASVITVTIPTDLSLADSLKFVNLVNSKNMNLAGCIVNMANVFPPLGGNTLEGDSVDNHAINGKFVEEYLGSKVLCQLDMTPQWSLPIAGLDMIKTYDAELSQTIRSIL